MILSVCYRHHHRRPDAPRLVQSVVRSVPYGFWLRVEADTVRSTDFPLIENFQNELELMKQFYKCTVQMENWLFISDLFNPLKLK